MQTNYLQKNSNILIFIKYNLIDKTGGNMINKKSLWFLTLFSLILVLSIYYITMPSELLLTTGSNISKNENTNTSEPTINIEESDLLVALRVESDEEMSKEIEELQLVLTNADSSVEEKNKAYEKIKDLNSNRALEEKLESQIKESHKLEAFVKIKGDNISVIVKSNDHSNNLANNIMRTIQSNYDKPKYITIKFQE